jgi:hypothetical protein
MLITPNHFEKMNTSLSVALLSHDVAAAILYQISAKNIEAKHQTTAWFLTHSLHSIVMLLKSGQKRRANTRYFVKFVLQHSAADLQVSFCHVQQYIADVQCSDEIVPIAVSLEWGQNKSQARFRSNLPQFRIGIPNSTWVSKTLATFSYIFYRI